MKKVQKQQKKEYQICYVENTNLKYTELQMNKIYQITNEQLTTENCYYLIIVMEKFGNVFQSFEGQNDGATLKNSRAIGLYFGSNWCEPCQRFLPTLNQFYDQINTDIHQFEIIYFGMDEKQSAFNDYTRDMPWLFYEWKDPLKYKLYFDFKSQIQGIPCLIILNPNNGNVVTTQGRGMIEKDGLEAFDKWLTQMSFK